MLTRRTFSTALASLVSSAAQSGRRRNVLLITVDNLGYGDLGCYGNTQIKSPHMDRFAAQGVRFVNFYCASPTCTASRAGLLTGRHPIRCGLNYQLRPDENKRGIGLPHAEKLIPQYLKPHGYATACFGKWNLGFAPGSRPTERGFDEFFGHRSGNIDYYSHIYNGDLDMYRGTQPARVEGYSVDLFADEAIGFLRRKRSQPFFLYLPFNSPHFPNKANLSPGESPEWQAPEKYFAEYGYSPKETDDRKRYRVVVTALDDAIGRVLKTLDVLGLTESTVVYIGSDNGAFMLPQRGLEVQTNAPLRDGGVTCWEGGIRVAGMARWPGVTPQGADCKVMLSAMDLLPMSLAAALVPVPAEPVLDGRDPTSALRGDPKPVHEALYFEYEKHQAMRTRQWKLVRPDSRQPWQLYDLEADQGERNNLASAQPEQTARLAARYDQWRSASLARTPR